MITLTFHAGSPHILNHSAVRFHFTHFSHLFTSSPSIPAVFESLPSTPSSSSSPSLSLSLSHSLSLSAALLQAIFVPLAHCGKTTHYGKRGGVDPVGRVAVLWSRSHYQQRGREGWEGDREGGEENRLGKMGAGVQLWVNCVPTVAGSRDQLPSNDKNATCQRSKLTLLSFIFAKIPIMKKPVHVSVIYYGNWPWLKAVSVLCPWPRVLWADLLTSLSLLSN